MANQAQADGGNAAARAVAPLTGRVEIDDAYLGGEVRGGKASLGSPNKVPFVAPVPA